MKRLVVISGSAATRRELARQLEELFGSSVTLESHAGKQLKHRPLLGDPPSPIDPPSGCHFHPRCPRDMDRCREVYPERKEVAPGHFTSCRLT